MFNWTRDAPEKILRLVHIVVLMTNQYIYIYKSPNPAQRNHNKPTSLRLPSAGKSIVVDSVSGGQGASGACVQNLNLALGFPEAWQLCGMSGKSMKGPRLTTTM